jgi:hypothetical protein
MAHKHGNEVGILSMANPSQLRETITQMGSRKTYILDIPRKVHASESLDNLTSTLEELKNGCVQSFMYGKRKAVFMQPPLLIIFCNDLIDIFYFSEDRVEVYKITSFNQQNLTPMSYKDALLELENKRDNMQISLGYAQARNEHYFELGRKKFAQNLRKNLSTPSINV